MIKRGVGYLILKDQKVHKQEGWIGLLKAKKVWK